MPIDYVTTFVDGSDTNWRRLYAKTFGRAPEAQRFRNYDTLKYALRGVEECMPWIRNVVIIVQSETQIPKWLDRNHPKVRIVYHKDFIPKEFLPTFNSNVIEMFISKIPGLSNEFILANDDMIAVKRMPESEFFRDGKAVDKINITLDNYKGPTSSNLFEYTLFNTAKLAAKAANKQRVVQYRNWHLFIPHLKSIWNYIWEKYGSDIKVGLFNSAKRTRRNYIHWVFRYFGIATGKYIDDRSLNTEGYMYINDSTTEKEIEDKIKISNIVCLNDGINHNTKVLSYVKNALQKRFPNPSTFEGSSIPLNNVSNGNKKYSVLTYIFGNYDVPTDPMELDPECEYVLVTDNKNITSKVWNVKYLKYSERPFDNVLYVRYHPFEFVQTNTCIVLDASLVIKKSLNSVYNRFINSGCNHCIALNDINPGLQSEVDWWHKNKWRGLTDQEYKIISDLISSLLDKNYKNSVLSGFQIATKTSESLEIHRKTWNMIVDTGYPIRLDEVILGIVIGKYFSDSKLWLTYSEACNNDKIMWRRHGTAMTPRSTPNNKKNVYFCNKRYNPIDI